MSQRARPARPWAPTAVTVAIIGTWWLVAHNGGSGWVQTLGDVVFGALSIGILGPAVILARARTQVTRCPADGTAGWPIEVEVTASTRLRVRPISPPGPETFAGPVWRRRRRSKDIIVLQPDRRGVHEKLIVEIATAAPFGLQWWARRVELPLPEPLHIAPRCGEPVALSKLQDVERGESLQRVPADHGEPRGARPYRSGDRRRHVHWQATAHARELMIREMERPAAEPVDLKVVLPADRDEAERMAERAFGTVVACLDQGAPVRLSTFEAVGPVSALVTDRRGAGRRLASAEAPQRGDHQIAGIS